MRIYKIQRTDEHLEHHGVDGQKWGVRRYQNEDGSYKPGAEGRYDPDGKSGHTFKNKVKAMRKQAKAEERAKQQKQRDEYAEKKHMERQAKRDERASKNSYKKIAGKYILKNIGYTVAGNVIGNAVAKKTGSVDLGGNVNAAIQGVGKSANLIRSGKQAYELYDYRKRKNAQHSDISEYDALYHSEDGMTYGIIYA